MSLAKFFSAAKNLPFEERVELAHRLWDEFMDGFQDWKAPPMPEGDFAWKTLKAEIDSELSRSDRIELAQQVWGNIQENGFDPELTPEQIAELDRRAEDALKNPGRETPVEEVSAEIRGRLPARKQHLVACKSPPSR
jgi:putative addiction module component (TIGR02574 family)